MPFNVQVFKVRALSAIVFAAVMLTGLLWNLWSFLLLFIVIHAGCWIEYVRLIEKIDGIRLHRFVTLGFIVAGMAIMLAFCGDGYTLGSYPLRGNLLLPLSLAAFLLLTTGILQKETQTTVRGFARAGLGLLYLSLSWGMMLSLRQYGMGSWFGDMGKLIVIVLIASIWINDTMAYMVGSFIGKTPLSPVSPKKTREGTIGGIILSVVAVALIANFQWRIGWMYAIVIPLLTSIAGTLGDLLESKLKRLAGVKDSGYMMPGHGGFLDRFDSLLLATPVVWVFVQFFG